MGIINANNMRKKLFEMSTMRERIEKFVTEIMKKGLTWDRVRD